MPSMTITKLRSQLYQTFDKVIQTGIPVEIKRNGQIVKIILEEKKSKLANLVAHDCIVGDPENLINEKIEVWNAGNDL